MDLVTNIYQKTEEFPDSEKYGLVSQIRRSAVSIPSNIAEGYGRNSNGEFQRYLNISMGSLFELQTQIEIAQNLDYFENDSGAKMYDMSREIERMMSSFMRSLND